MADSSHVVDVTAETFHAIVVEGSLRQPVLVDFWASWCGPCQMLTPVLTRLAERYAGKFLLAKVNTEDQQALAMQFGIRSIPTCKLFRDGRAVDEFMGALPESEITAFLERHIPRESDLLIARAGQLAAKGDTPGALGLLGEAAEQDPDNPRALVALARLQAANGDSDAARQTLDRLPADAQMSDEVRALRSHLTFSAAAGNARPRAELEAALAADENDSEARFQLAARLVTEDDLEGALDHLLTLMRKDRRYGDDAARKAMVQIFDMLGDDPVVPRYRSRMMNLLY